MRLSSRERAFGTLALVLALTVATVGCTRKGAASAYEQRVLDIDRALNDGIRQLLNTPGSTSTDATALAVEAANQLRTLTPPPQYEKGHGLLLELYTLSATFFGASGDDADEEARLAQQLLDLRGQVHEELPFLIEDSPPIPGFPSP